MSTELTPLLRYCLETTAGRLTDEFRGVVSRGTVRRYVEVSYEGIGDRPTVGPSFLPGSRPDEQVDEVVVEAMGEIGLDLSAEFPKPLTDAVIRAADVVVTLGCGDACPVYPGKRYQDWPVDDPAGRSLAVVRRIRYELYHHVWELIETLVPALDLLDLQRPMEGES